MAENRGLTYQVNQQRSKSLLRGGGPGGSVTARNQASGIGTGTARLGVNHSTISGSRQRDFEVHVERFNQLDPLVKGQTIDYSNSGGQANDSTSAEML